MKSEPVVGVQPDIIRWARDSVGLSVEDVAHKLKRAPEEILAWESGQSAPTYAQLEKLAYELYKRPLAVFFLPEAPAEIQPRSEFRTLPDADLQQLDRDTYFHIRRAHAYQLALTELFSGTNPFARCIWRELSLSPEHSVVTQAQRIRDYLGITFEQQLGWKHEETGLKKWRQSIEEAGVFIFKAAFKQKDISGFCLVDAQFPLIYINNSTTKTRQIFSLLHELAHLLLSINGLSKFDTSYIDRLLLKEQRIERFCNAIAAEVLIPHRDFAQQASTFPLNVEQASDEQIANLASRYGVSREVVLRRFLDLGRVSQAFYEAKARYWTAQMKAAGGGSWYANQGSYLSERFAREVVARHYQHQITLEQAADFLGIKPRNFAGLEERILHGARA